MKAHAESALAWGKEVYAGLFADSEKKEVAEAMSLGCDQSTAHNYLDQDSSRHIPFGLVPNSLFAVGMCEALCQRLNGAFIHVHGRLNGNDQDERRTILSAMAKLQKESDPKVIDALYATIEEAAARARKEETR